jgi:hypothetical protein
VDPVFGRARYRMISVEQRFGYSRNLRARRRSISADARLHARRARSSLTRIIAALPGSALEPEHFGCWRCRMISDGRRPERFQAKACPGLDPGWIPVRVKKTRQNKKLEPRSDSIGTEKALATIAARAIVGAITQCRWRARQCAIVAESRGFLTTSLMPLSRMRSIGTGPA